MEKMTREELTVTTVDDLRKIASEMGIKNASETKKFDLIDKILAEQEAPSAPKDVTDAPATEEVVFTDRHEKPVAINMRASFRVQGKFLPGTITKMKIIENEQYIGGMLDGTDKTKLFHSTDVDIDVPTGSVPSAPAPTKEPKAPKEPKAKKEKAPKEPKVREKDGRPVEGSKSLEILEMLENGFPKAEVAKKLGVKYQFVQSISKRYYETGSVLKLTAKVKATEAEESQEPQEDAPELEGNVVKDAE